MKTPEQIREYRRLYMRKWMVSHREIIRLRESKNYYRDREKVLTKRREEYSLNIDGQAKFEKR